MVIKLFKGQVKIADVKAAFNEIIDKVNTMVENYNNSSYIQDIDYSVGGSTLAPSGYTLTVGGMKQFMEACDGSVIGAKPFRVSSNKLKMTTGLLVTKHGIYRLPDSVLAIPTDKQYRTIYYNTSTGEYQLTGQGTINEIVTEERFVKSNLYYGYSGGADPMLLRKEVYDSNIIGARTLGIINVPEKSLQNCIAFFKNTENANTAESVAGGSIKIPLEMYAHVCGNLTGDDTLYLAVKDKGADNRNGVSMGTYNPDTEIYEPKLDITYYTASDNYLQVNINGCQKFGIDETYHVPYYALSPIGNCKSVNNDTVSSIGVQFKHNEFGMPVAKIMVNGLGGFEIYSTEIQMPMDIDSYNINTLIPRTWYMNETVNSVEGDPFKPSNKEFWYPSDCVILRKDDERVELTTLPQIITINTIKVIESDTAAYRICDINPYAETKLISNIKGVQNEKVSGSFKITSESRYVKPVCGGNYASGGFRGETPDTSSAPLFIWGQEAVAREGEKTAMTYLFGKLVQWNKQSGHRNLDWWSPLNMLFVPKGVANPYTYSDTFSNFTHWFKVNISKNIKDT